VKNDDIRKVIGSLNRVIPFLPFWLLLFYFREGISRFLIYNLFSMQQGDKLAMTLTFFITTMIKIYLLLVFVIFAMGMVRTWFPVQNTKRRLMALPELPATAMAGIFGILTPFCSCSAVPMFISFLETGVPLGMTFSFLIASPLVNEVIIIMLAGLFGIRIALIYAAAGLFVAITSGYIIGKLKLERYLPAWLLDFRNEKQIKQAGFSLDNVISGGIAAVTDVLYRTWAYILAGIIIGSVIHGYVPEDWLSTLPGSNRWYSLPLAVLSGIPLYSCSASIAPVAFSLVDKGMPLGTVLAFIMAVAGLSLPEFIMLKKVLSARLIAIFAGIVFTGILLVGYLFNLLL
jgi:uncharacterized protein